MCIHAFHMETLRYANPRVIEVVLDKNAGFPFITLNQSFSSVLIQDQYVDSWLFWNIDVHSCVSHGNVAVCKSYTIKFYKVFNHPSDNWSWFELICGSLVISRELVRTLLIWLSFNLRPLVAPRVLRTNWVHVHTTFTILWFASNIYVKTLPNHSPCRKIFNLLRKIANIKFVSKSTAHIPF